MILILDFGAQYTQLIARRVREAHVYCEIHPFNLSLEQHSRRCGRRASSSRAGRRASTRRTRRCRIRGIAELGVPLLGICYGMGVLVQEDGGAMARADAREYGPAELIVDDDGDLFAGFDVGQHDAGVDEPRRPPRAAADGLDRCSRTAPTRRSRRCADRARRRYGDPVPSRGRAHAARPRAAGELPLPHLPGAGRLDDGELHRARDARASARRSARPASSAACSGGVDSTVTAALIHRAIGDQLTCIFVDNGVLRRDEAKRVMQFLGDAFHFRIKAVDAGALS